MGLIVLVGIAVAVFSPQEDPLDRSAIKSRQLVTEIYVVDSTNNGFRVSYATINSVTRERFEEIRSRPAVRDSLSKLMEVAPRKFPDMVHLDIYDFADFAKRFDPADIRIHNIFVYGREKENMYIGDNPLIRNPARSIDRRTAQGLLYIRDEDITFRIRTVAEFIGISSAGVCFNSLTLTNISATSPKRREYNETQRKYINTN